MQSILGYASIQSLLVIHTPKRSLHSNVTFSSVRLCLAYRDKVCAVRRRQRPLNCALLSMHTLKGDTALGSWSVRTGPNVACQKAFSVSLLFTSQYY